MRLACKRISFILIIHFFSAFIYLYAQTKVDSSFSKKHIQEIVFKGNHFGFNFAMNAVAKAKVENNTTYNTTAKPNVGILLGVNYNINFRKLISLNTGVNFGLSGRNFFYNISRNSFTPSLSNDIVRNSSNSQTALEFLQLPLLLEKRWFKQKNYWFADIGLNIDYRLNNGYEMIGSVFSLNGNPTIITRFETAWPENNRLFLNYSLGYGLGIITKKNKIHKIGLRANISFNEMAKSNYTFSIPNQPSFSGNHSLSGSYIGFYYTRLFTSANHRLRKILQKS